MSAKPGRRGIAVAAIAAAVSCAPLPTVYYTHPVAAPLPEGAIVVALPGSRVTLAPRAFAPASGLAWTPEQTSAAIAAAGEDAARTVDDLEGVRAIVTAVECGSCLVAVTPAGTAGTRTRLSVRFRENSRLVEAVGAEVHDSRLRAVQAAGALITAAAPRGEHSDLELRLPAVLDFSEAGSLDDDGWAKIPGNPGWWYRLRDVRREVGATELRRYVSEHTRSPASTFPVAACADARLQVAQGGVAGVAPPAGADVAEYAVRLADPRYVRTMPLPARGTIATHTVCGADLVSEGSDAVSAYDLLEAAATEAGALRRSHGR